MSTLRFYQAVSIGGDAERHEAFFLKAEAALLFVHMLAADHSLLNVLAADPFDTVVIYRCTVTPDSHTREEVSRTKVH